MQVPFIGTIPFVQDCRVPDGWIVKDLKLCECCGVPFLRTAHSMLKYCAKCRARFLLPPVEEIYREALPAIPNKSYHLPHYDDSLTVRIPLRVHSIVKINWLLNLRALCALIGPLTREEMREYTGHSDVNSLATALRCRATELVHVGSAWPRTANRTTGMYLVK